MMLSKGDSLNKPTLHFDPSMSRRTRRPSINLQNTAEDYVALQRLTLKELMVENNKSRREEESIQSVDINREYRGEEIVECRSNFDGGATAEKSGLALVPRKKGLVGRYMKVLNHLIKAKHGSPKRRQTIQLPLK